MVEKHLLVLGGAGKSGIIVVKQVLEKGHKVTAYARNATKLREEHSDAVDNQKLTVSSRCHLSRLPSNDFDTIQLIECDIPSLPPKLSPLLPSFDTIISVLGPNSLSYTGTEIAQLYEWMLAELRQLRAEQRPYLLVMSTQSIVDPQDGFDLFTKIHIFFIMTIAPGARRETMAIKKVFMGEATSQKDDIDWTVCRLNLLKDTGLPIEGGKAGYVGKNGWLSTMDRAQLAYWLVGEAEKERVEREWVRKMPALWGDDKV
jgi:hypothetical protein